MKTTMPNNASHWPWTMVAVRLVLFASIQALFAFSFLLIGLPEAWENSANWWPFAVTITNFISIALLVRLFRREGQRFWDIFRIQKEHIKSDLIALLGLLIILGPVSFLPNIWLGKLLFGDPQRTLDLIVRPLPLWAAYAGVILFPATQGLAELATYFAYAMPRLESQGMRRWLAVTVPSLFLAIQHIAVPLLFNPRFILWRGLMFVPFAFLAGIVMRWRPRLLPYLAVIHVLMDLSFATMLINAAY